jgi:hypothetical protein
MSRESDTRSEKAQKVFRRKKILTLAEVADLLHASIHTARRRLKEWNALSSYNQNGQYYALPDVPEFDINGLWRCHGVFFSRYGNLKQTVVELVRISPGGLGGGELGSLLGLDPRSFLSAFTKHPGLRREKVGGRFVYFSSDQSVYEQQRQRRLALNATGRQPTPAEAITILVEKIKHPTLSYGELSRKLRKQKMSVEPGMIENLFALHGLTEKKTPHST